jgi:hypothetical protein
MRGRNYEIRNWLRAALVGLPVKVGSVSPSAARIAKAVELPLQPDMEGSHVGQTKPGEHYVSGRGCNNSLFFIT